MHEIHTPPFLWADWHGSRPAMQGDVLSSAHPHAQLEPLKAIPAPDPLPVDRPPFPPQEDPDSQIAESGAGMGQIANAQPQGGLIRGLTLPIPRRATKLS
jgi:hypothetical protein